MYQCNSCGDIPDCLILKDMEYLCPYCYGVETDREEGT